MYFLRNGFVCPQSPYPDNDIIFWIFAVVTHFACDIGQSVNIWICVLSEVITLCYQSTIGLLPGYFTSCYSYTVLRDPTTSRELSTVAALGFQFGLCHIVHVVVPLILDYQGLEKQLKWKKKFFTQASIASLQLMYCASNFSRVELITLFIHGISSFSSFLSPINLSNNFKYSIIRIKTYSITKSVSQSVPVMTQFTINFF